MDTLLNIYSELLKSGGTKEGWTIRPDFHVTILFMADKKDSEVEKDPIFQNFKEKERVDVEVRAVILVADRIMTAVCFPKYEVANEFPHMTLFLQKWKAVQSNLALESTCSEGKVFSDLYEKAK